MKILLLLSIAVVVVVVANAKSVVREKRNACDVPVLGMSFSSCKNQDKDCPNYHVCKNGKEGICCPTKNLVCKLEFDAGTPCGDKQKRWYYSHRTKKCRDFTYFGCAGNLNNFITQQACEQYCGDLGKTVTKEPAVGKVKAG